MKKLNFVRSLSTNSSISPMKIRKVLTVMLCVLIFATVFTVPGTVNVDASPSPVIGLDFNQMDFKFDGTTYYNNTEWGSVNFTFIGQEPIMYFNLAVNGSWQVQNIPVLSDNGVGVIQNMTYYFDLGTERGTDVTSLNYDYAFTSDILGTMPGGSNPASVGDDYIALWAGTQGGLMPDLAPAEPLVGGKVASKKHTQDPKPNQECDPNECIPTAVSNSLKFLYENNLLPYSDDQPISIAAMKGATGWKAGGAPLDTWWEIKKKYMEDHKYPITTRKTSDMSDIEAQIDAGQDVEIQESWVNKTTGERTGHVSRLVGIQKMEDGRYSMDVAEDRRQGKKGGTVTHSRTYNPATGDLKGGPPEGSKFDFAVVECPEFITLAFRPLDDTYKASIKIRTIHNVSSWKAGFRFDPHILECVNFTEGPYLSDVGTTTWTPGTIDNVNGIVTSHNCTLEAGKSQNGTGVLAYIAFRVKNYGKTAINLTDEDGDPCECMVLDSYRNEVPLTFIDGEFTVRPGPKADFVYSPIAPWPKETVTFDASSSTPGWNQTTKKITKYEWTFGDGTPKVETCPVLGVLPRPVTHRYNSIGTYNVTLRVTCEPGVTPNTDTTWKLVNVNVSTAEPFNDTAVLWVAPLGLPPYAGQAIGVPGCDATYVKWHKTWTYNFYIEVFVKNLGTVTASNVVVSLYNGTPPTLIGKQTITLGPHADANLKFPWIPIENLTFPARMKGYPWPYPKRPDIKANITVVQGDVNATNNELLWGTLTIRYPGDAGRIVYSGGQWIYYPPDGKVYVEDLLLFGKWGWGADRSKTGSAKTKYEAFGFWCDFNADGKVSVEDLAVLGKNWGAKPIGGGIY